MIKELVSLASVGIMEQGWLGDLFTKWGEIGFFSYLLPFLLIFALVFGILTKTRLFQENKAINAIIALVVSLIAIQFEAVPTFFSVIFPKVGIALAIILALIILVGLFIDPRHPALAWILIGIGTIILIVVIVQTAGALGWSTGAWWQENWVTVIGLIIVLALIITIIASSAKGKLPFPKSVWGREFEGKEKE